jgi:hypothetical protein
MTGGFLSARGLTTEAVMVDVDSQIGKTASKLKDLTSKK